MTGRHLLPLAVVVVALTGCAGSSCGELPARQAERAEMRQDYRELLERGGTPEQTAEADDALHAFEREVFDLEQQCADS